MGINMIEHTKWENTRPLEWYEDDEEDEIAAKELEDQIEYLLKKGDIHDSTTK